MTAYGVQIFGCMKEFRQDPKGFFARLAEMGYRQIEPCVIFDAVTASSPEFASRLWKPEEVPVFEDMMKAEGLFLSSCHIFTKEPLKATEAMRALARETTIDTYAINCGIPDIEKNYPRLAELCSNLEGELSKDGISLWIHNGGGEVRARVQHEGKEMSALEAVLALCKGKVGVQVDTGWVLHGGADPAKLMKDLGKLLKSVHFKDMARGFENLSGNDIFAVLGQGVTDCASIFEATPKTGVSILIDQDATQGDFFEDLKVSIDLLRSYRP